MRAAIPLLLVACACADAASPVRRLPRLRADGARIVDEAGREVRLRGVNLGGWMFHETWITLAGQTGHGALLEAARAEGLEDPVLAAMREAGPDCGDDPAITKVCPGSGDAWEARLRPLLGKAVGEARATALLDGLAARPAMCDDSDLALRRVLSARFGDDGRDALLDAFQRAWMTEADVAWIAAPGMNVVRVPIGYRSLMRGPDSERPAALDWNPLALERLSDLLRDRPEVAAYSLLAEPYGAPDAAARDRMYDRLVKAIRARGDDHVLVIHDGFRGMKTLPVPADVGWDGVAYSTHLFEWTAADLAAYRILFDALYGPAFEEAQPLHGVPYYIGSFSTFLDAEWAYEAAAFLVGWMEARGLSWSLRTYKRLDDPLSARVFGWSTSWGLRGRLSGAFRRPDPHADGFDALRAAFEAYRDLDVRPNEALLAVVKVSP